MMNLNIRRFLTWGWAWIALTSAFALHIVDEVVNDFLGVYNPTVSAIRERLPFLSLPTFTFGTWLTGLILAIVVLLALSPFAFRGVRELRFLAYPYAVIMFLNGLQHIVGSIYFGRLMPGFWTAPLLLLTSAALFVTTRNKWSDDKSA